MSESKSLEARIQRLEDIEAIRKLKHLYCRITDTGWDKPSPPAMTLRDIFTEDGSWENPFTAFGVWDPDPSRKVFPNQAYSRENLTNYVPSPGPTCIFGIHYTINGSIEVDGDRAKGYWHCLGVMTLADLPADTTGKAMWISGMYEEEYRRTAEGWKYQHVIFHPAFFAPNEEGWVQSRFPAPLPGAS